MNNTATFNVIDWDVLGCTLRPEPLNEQAYYSISNTNDPVAVQGMIRRCVDLNIWMQQLPDDDDDFELYARRMSSTFGVTTGYVRAAVFGLVRLAELPVTSAVFYRLVHLDIDRLIGINNTLDKLGPSPDAAMMQRIDEKLAEYLTPTRRNQRMPSRRSIINFLNELIALEDSSLPNVKVKARLRYNITYSGKQAFIELQTGAEAGAVIDECIKELAKRKGISHAKAAIELLTGEENPQAKLILNMYQHKTESAPVFIPGIGWLDPDDAEEMLERLSSTRDMDEASTAETEAYSPTDAIRAAVVGLDGTCRWPGCDVSAHKSQTDHRHNHSEGGPTSAWNIASLCQHHHNVKTDRRAFYIMDPFTREIYWLFSDGSWETSLPSGPMSEGKARWAQTVTQANSSRRRNARAFAQMMAEVDDVAEKIAEEILQEFDDEEPPF